MSKSRICELHLISDSPHPARKSDRSGFAHRLLSPGPYGANIIDPRSWGNSEEATNNLTLEFTRIVIAIGVFAVGVELPKKYMYRHWRSLFFLLVPVMTWVRRTFTRHSTPMIRTNPAGLVRLGCLHLCAHPQHQLPFSPSYWSLSHPY
jgi:hypothetical protein